MCIRDSLQSVAHLAREMVTRFGFSSLGPIALETEGSEVFLGRDLIHTRPSYAESTGKVIDEQIRALAVEALEQAINLLSPRREVMDLLVDALIQEETLHTDPFQQLAGLTVDQSQPVGV